MPYVESDEGAFIGVKETNYLTKMQEKAEQLNLVIEDQLTPQILEQSPHKLHVSLAIEEYNQYKDTIKNIIIKHLEMGTIKDFKYINSEIINTTIVLANQMLQLIQDYKHMCDKQERPDEGWREKYFEAASNYFGRRSLPHTDEIDELIKKLQTTINSGQRLLDGDQFTIYLSENYDKHQILDLCKDLNNFFLQQRAIPGRLLDVESPLGEYMNLRQEYVLDDFAEINKTGYVNSIKRISATQLSFTDEESAKRKQVVKEQEASSIYQYLKNNLQGLPSLQTSSSFYKPNNLSTEEKTLSQNLSMECR